MVLVAAGWPEICDSALLRLAPVRLNRLSKAGGSAPPLLKKLLMATAAFCWLPPGLLLAPSEAVRFSITLFDV